MYMMLDQMAAFVPCRYKAFLKCTGEVGVVTEYELLERELAVEYQEKAIAWLTTRFTAKEILSSPPSLENELQGRSHLIVNAPCQPDRGSFNFPAIERTTPRTSTGKHEHALIAFSPNNKLSKDENLTAAILASALSSWHGLTVACVKMIHGPRFSTTKLVLLGTKGHTRLGNEAAATFHDLEAMVASPTPPPMYLNDHCGICEYRDRCRKAAVDRDDLSLLRGLQPKEIEAWKKRGIFTVTQLAHTFRPKTMGRSSLQPKRHSQPLQAMAIRDKTTYVRKRPDTPAAATKVYLDVEGIPDTDLFYLIGLLVVKDNGEPVRHQFWADGEMDQTAMWHNFLSALEDLEDYVLIHFGRYEKDFLREMSQRYGMNGGVSEGRLLARLFNVHAAIRTNVFFPVYSNGLKQLATFLGFQWQGPVRSGVDSIVWRCKWEKTQDTTVKDALLRYNHEDCLAVLAVFNHLAALSQPTDGTTVQCTETDALPSRRGDAFGKSAFALPGLETISKRAYFDYQQQKVFFRTDKNVRRSIRRKRRGSKVAPKANKTVECQSPAKCLKCGKGPVMPVPRPLQVKVVRDLKFFSGGVKRWVIRYSAKRHECRSCRHTCYSPEFPTGQEEFGHGLASWAVYQHVALRQSFESLTASVNDVFGYSFCDSMVKKAHAMLARTHEATENLLLSKLRSGDVICGDEAKMRIRRGVDGYVWAFSGPEVVIYRFSKSRDATVMNEILKGFTGVLVSDFYNVYDSAPCSQQKCIVHLVRDINDDLLKAPFDKELKELATRFTGLMTPIIESIDRYGLTKRHLGRFRVDAVRYQKWVARQQFTSKITQGYQKRIGKYGDRLFTFLSHDGVPWNNNLAENAVKLIASRRKLLDGVMSENGIRDYLIFLSIYQTLRRKGGSFLRFLLSKKTDLFEFLGE